METGGRQNRGQKEVLCKYYEGKALFTGMLHLYAETRREMNESLEREDDNPSEEFREHRRRKRTASENETVRAKKSSVNPGIRNARVQSQVPTRKFFSPLRIQMEFEDNREYPNSER
jgi:hypothetical protein